MITPTANICRRIYWILAGAAGISSLPAQVEYQADGIPTPLEEEIRWHTNRARFDRNAENALRRTNYTDVPLSSGPLAPHYSLTMASRRHAEDCARLNAVGHLTPVGSTYYTVSSEGVNRFTAEGSDILTCEGKNLADRESH